MQGKCRWHMRYRWLKGTYERYGMVQDVERHLTRDGYAGRGVVRIRGRKDAADVICLLVLVR